MPEQAGYYRGQCEALGTFEIYYLLLIIKDDLSSLKYKLEKSERDRNG
jgi:hypothetical protein